MQRGDTLSRLSRQHGIPIESIRKWNRLDSDRIYPGQELTIEDPTPRGPYTVRRGDTLASIARRHHTTVASLRAWNRIQGDRILLGQALVVEEPESAAAAPVSSTLTVEAGDALWEIASTHGMSVYELQKLNGLTSTRIYPGQVLKLGPGAAAAVEDYRVRPGDTLGEIRSEERRVGKECAD